jgi:transposase
MPDELFDTLAQHLPPEQPVGLEGGRPRVGHRIVVRVIWFVLTTVSRWDDVPAELGCAGRTAHRRSGLGRRPASGTGSTPIC